ncbi:MAG: IS630 family transposase [Ktedonobacterales bacterium]
MATAFPEAQVEVWATDEHRIGLKPILKRVWTLPGKRPIAPFEPRYAWRYLVAFAHPASGRTLWQLATAVSTDVFSVELAAFAEAAGAGPRKQVILVLDGAGWHTSPEVRVPEHVHLLFLPAHSPELQPCEHLWQFSDAPLVKRHFRDIEELEDVQMARCAVLQAQPERMRSATLFPWWPRRVKKRQGP